MRKLVIEDIHGNVSAMMEALERASFSPSNHVLITLKDVVDGYESSYEVVQF